MRNVSALACALLVVSCVGGGSGAEPDGEEAVETPSIEAASELDQGPPAAIAADAGAMDAVDALAELPRWHAYIRGTDGIWQGHPYPGELDAVGQVVAIRERDEECPEKWVTLSLTDHCTTMMGKR